MSMSMSFVPNENSNRFSHRTTHRRAKAKKIVSALPQKHVSWVDAVKQSFCGSSSSSMSGSSGSSRLVVVVVAQSFNNKQW